MLACNAFQIFKILETMFDTFIHNLTAGLIIDAFGELRDQQEQVKEDMEVQCNSLS